MATYTWAALDGVTVVSTTVHSHGAVSSGDTVGAFTTPTDDDYRLGFQIINIAPAGAAGPFSLTLDASIGDVVVELASGGSGISVGDVVILKDGVSALNRMVNTVRLVSTNTITLNGRLLLDLPSATATLEIAPKLEVTGTEGVGSDTTQSITETIWLSENLATNWYPTRAMYDRNTSVSIVTTFFSADSFDVHEWIDPANVFRSDRKSRRALMSAVRVANTTPAVFDEPFLSNASGHKDGTKGFGANTGPRVAEQHPPIRLEIDITAFVLAGGVTIEGFRTVWSPVRQAIAGGTGVVAIRISPGNFEQFQIGDVVDLYDLTTDLTEQRTISAKTAPDIITVSVAITNSYTVDDIVGIVQSENVTISGAGTFYTADAWVYPLFHNTVAGPDDFSYQVFSSVQGKCGELLSMDHRAMTPPGGFAGGYLRQNSGIYQIATSMLIGDGTTHTMFGTPAGALSLPRTFAAGKMQFASSKSFWWMGYKSWMGTTSSVYIHSRPGPNANEFMFMLGSATNGVVLLGCNIGSTKSATSNAFNAAHGAPSLLLVKDCLVSIGTPFNSASTNIIYDNIVTTFDDANESISDVVSGTNLTIGGTTTADSYRVIKVLNQATFALQAFGGFVAPNQTMRISDFNSRVDNHVARESHSIRLFTALLAGNSDNVLRSINSYFSEVRWGRLFGTVAGLDPLIESAITVDVQVVNEIGDPVEGARVILVDNAGTERFDEITNAVGRIAQHELITHRYDVGSSTNWNVIWIPPAIPASPVNETDFSPFELIVLPTANADGYVPSRVAFSTAPFMATESKEFVIVLNVPRPDGQFGDAGFDQF